MTYDDLKRFWHAFTGCDYPGDDTPEDREYGEEQLKEIIEKDTPWRTDT